MKDLESVFETIRKWESIREPKPGIFYFKSKPFLHFHIQSEERFAHIRSGTVWERLDAPQPIAKTKLKSLEKVILGHYQKLKSR